MRYDYLIVGGGIAGLTMARLLSLLDARVLLVEKDAELGGSSKRFMLDGVPFDTGFHFTGGLTPDKSGLLDEILAVLGVADRIVPVFADAKACHRMVFPSIQTTYLAPLTLERLQAQLKRDFPRHRAGLDRYFVRLQQVIDATPSVNLAGFATQADLLPEDNMTLQAALDECVPDELLQVILGAFAVCYGASPNQVSLAAHARMCFGLYQSMGRVRHGGQAFVDALAEVMREDDRVEIRTPVALEQCTDFVGRRAGRFVLSDGTSVEADRCIFTTHPQQIADALTSAVVSKAFRERVADFEPSIGFFALFGTRTKGADDAEQFVTTVYPELDLNRMLTCHTEHAIPGPLVLLGGAEEVDGHKVDTVSMLEVSFPQWTQRWADSRIGQRPDDYYAYKRGRTAGILERVGQWLPDDGVAFNLLDSASMLTFRDYLHNPEGSAYGIRQKQGQFNVVGRLPVRNCYAIGQSALLPGLLGAMCSAFFVCRNFCDADRYSQLLRRACS